MCATRRFEARHCGLRCSDSVSNFRLAEACLRSRLQNFIKEREFVTQAIVRAHRRAQVAGNDVRGLRGPSLRGRDDRVGSEADAAKEPAEPLGLLPALVRPRPARVRAVPGAGIAGVGVAKEKQLGHGRREPIAISPSTSWPPRDGPVARPG